MNPTHQKNKSLKLEDLRTGVRYAVTLSPPECRDKDTARSNTVRTFDDFKAKYIELKLFIGKLHSCKLELYPELSPTGRLHYHGFLQIKNIFTFMWHDLYLLNQIVYEIDTIKDEDIWILYVSKQAHIMKPALDMFEEPYPMEYRPKEQKVIRPDLQQHIEMYIPIEHLEPDDPFEPVTPDAGPPGTD